MSGATRLALLAVTIEPRTPDDADTLTRALQRLIAEDGALSIQGREDAGEVVLGVSSEQHLEQVIERLEREFGVSASLGRPTVVYRAAVVRSAGGEMKYARQIRGHGEYAHVKIRLEPREGGAGREFANAISAGEIPAQFIAAVQAGIQERLAQGLDGIAIDDVRVELYDGSYHDVDSSAAAFTMAGFLATDDAVGKSDPILLEPLMRLEVAVPGEFAADVQQNLLARRGQIEWHDDSGATHVIRAVAPLAELFGYAHDLRSRTRGRGTSSMQFATYAPVQLRDESGLDPGVGVPRNPAPKPSDLFAARPEPPDDRE